MADVTGRTVAAHNPWILDPMLKVIGDFEACPKTYPPNKPGTPVEELSRGMLKKKERRCSP
jgi:hypothetical protein